MKINEYGKPSQHSGEPRLYQVTRLNGRKELFRVHQADAEGGAVRLQFHPAKGSTVVALYANDVFELRVVDEPHRSVRAVLRAAGEKISRFI